jgi:hypothetical protein
MTQPGLSSTSFLRSLGVPFPRAAAELQRWSEQQPAPGRNGRARPTTPVCLEPGLARAAMVLTRGRGPLQRPLRMELQLAPVWEGAVATQLELIARQRVRPGSRYYRVGHRALDSIVEALSNQDDPQPELDPAYGTEPAVRLAG